MRRVRFYLPDGALNASRINDKQLTNLIQKLNATVDEGTRNKLAKEATAKINNEMLTSSIVHPKNVVTYKIRTKLGNKPD